MISVPHKDKEIISVKDVSHCHTSAHTVLNMHSLSWLRTHTPYSSTMCLWDTCRIILAVSKKACQQKDKDDSLHGLFMYGFAANEY